MTNPVLTKPINVGIPTISITAIKTSATGEPTNYRFTASPLRTGLTYNWYVNNALSQSSANNTFDYYFPCNISKTITCSGTNGCGTSALSNSITKIGECIRATPYTLSPNPATSTVTVSGSASFLKSTNSTIASINQIRIYDLRGILKKDKRFNNVRSAMIDISELTNGTYFVEIINGNNTEKRQLVIQK